jgi:hypothetical protein
LLLATALCGCGRPTAEATSVPPVDPTGYLAPPTLTRASGLADGSATLAGHAPAGAVVSLHAPDGAAFSDTANPGGDWSINLPPADAPRMFAFGASMAGRDVHGEGAVLVLPSQETPALLVRAGYGAAPIGGAADAKGDDAKGDDDRGDDDKTADQKGGALMLTAVDIDGGGGGAVSGYATPRATVRFLLDGQPVGGGQGDASGRFVLLDLNTRVPFAHGAHRVRVESQGRAVETEVAVAEPDPGAGVFQAGRQGPAWRVSWRLPAGGAQTTLVFDPPLRPGSAPPSPPTAAPAPAPAQAATQ